MKKSQLLVTLVMLALLIAAGLLTRLSPENFGAVPWYGWTALVVVMLVLGLLYIAIDNARERSRVEAAIGDAQKEVVEEKTGGTVDLMELAHQLDPEGPPYPHPVINAATCIGCHSCVDACPHDVLAIVNGVSTPVALDQCMEDTSCQVECPTSPKSCIVVNTKKEIPERKVPKRDNRFMTNVPGIYLIGDVSGVPLIKNAINEGGSVIDSIKAELDKKGANGAADYDVAIVGIGPGGLSATAVAAQRGLRYVAIEQDRIAATIQTTYPAGKYVFFKPDTVETKGGIALDGAGASKEDMIGAWFKTVEDLKLKINEFETCKAVKNDNGVFVVKTESEKTKQAAEYRTRSVIIAVGGRGTPMRLRVAGEDIKFTVTPTEAVPAPFCVKCGAERTGDWKMCPRCGTAFPMQVPAPYEDEKVKYRLADPNLFSGKHCIVVGAGNSAIEAAVDLAAFRSDDGTQIIGWRDNTVTLVIRSDFKGDLKLGNKMLCYECMDEGKINVHFRKTIKEVFPQEVALMSARDRDPAKAKETDRIRNDYIFALIGGDKPTKFLESMGIQIGEAAPAPDGSTQAAAGD